MYGAVPQSYKSRFHIEKRSLGTFDESLGFFPFFGLGHFEAVGFGESVCFSPPFLVSSAANVNQREQP